MSSSRKTAKQIFLEAIEAHAPEQWPALLDQACGDDAKLRQRVEVLLEAHVEDDGLLDIPAVGRAVATDKPLAEQLGAHIGPYKLRELLAEGGMGSVFVAEQEQPIRRKVALKIIKPGMDTRQVLARFDAERQALALMDHPNIAKVLDAGTTESGRPYFVMELVRGVPITEFCDRRQLDPRQRLELFIQVCRAIQHAHQKGIIHRDIKPTNILVTLHDELAVPEVIDFGIAKATGQRLTEQSVYTAFNQMIGTPLYMSPEQAEMNALDVDTRSDIYSLGVLLYELLTGSTPFDSETLQQAGFDEMRRLIREVDPPRPSQRVSTLNAEADSTVAKSRGVDERQLSRILQGELDWIVMKALEKDRNRRYETASALAADVTHFLNDEPVSAAAPSRLYRAGKFVRRNKLAVIASAAVLLALVAGVIGMAIGLVSQSRQRIISERQRAEAQLNLANSLQSQRKYAEAEALYRQGLDSPSDATSEDRQRTARTRLHLAKVVYDRGDAAESETLHRDALAAYRAEFPSGDPNIAHALTTYALLLRAQHRNAEAEPLFREAYDIYRRAIPADQFAIGVSARYLASALIPLGRYDEAEPVLREGIAAHGRAASPDLWALAVIRIEHGRNLLSTGRFSEAEAELIEAQRVLASTEADREGIFALATLYAVWDQSAPGKGYDVKAREWFRKLIGTFVRLEKTPTEPKKASTN